MRGAPHHRSNRDVAAEHVRRDDGKPLCGRARRWGAVFVQLGHAPTCRNCLKALERATKRETIMKNSKIYQVRVESKGGSDLVSQHEKKSDAKKIAKALTDQTGKRHHVLTLDHADGLGELRGLLAF